MDMLICPNCDDVEMTSNAYGVFSRRDLTHICPECGYTEHRI